MTGSRILLAAFGLAVVGAIAFILLVRSDPVPSQREVTHVALDALRSPTPTAVLTEAQAKTIPDLSDAGLEPQAAPIQVSLGDRGTGTLYTFRDPTGQAVVLVVSHTPFAVPVGAETDPSGWRVNDDGTAFVAIQEPNPFLVAGRSQELVGRAVEAAQGELEPSRFQGHRPNS